MLIGLVLLTLFVPALIVLHELGHYWCAQWMGIELTDFSIGAGSLLRQWRHNGVDFKLHLWPISAYVRPATAKSEALKHQSECVDFCKPIAANPRLIQNHPASHQLLFLAGGALANISFAFVLLVVRELPLSKSFSSALGGTAVEMWGLALLLFRALFGNVGGIELSFPSLDFVQQLAFLSLSFGLINLVPVPPFDGGRILVILLRKMRRKA